MISRILDGIELAPASYLGPKNTRQSTTLRSQQSLLDSGAFLCNTGHAEIIVAWIIGTPTLHNFSRMLRGSVYALRACWDAHDKLKSSAHSASERRTKAHRNQTGWASSGFVTGQRETAIADAGRNPRGFAPNPRLKERAKSDGSAPSETKQSHQDRLRSCCVCLGSHHPKPMDTREQEERREDQEMLAKLREELERGQRKNEGR